MDEDISTRIESKERKIYFIPWSPECNQPLYFPLVVKAYRHEILLDLRCIGDAIATTWESPY